MADVLVLCYHAVSDRWPAALAVTPQALEAQLEQLLRRGYRGATFHDALHAPPARKTVAVTFDDAYRSVGELAFPILNRLGLPATVFVPTDFPDTGRPMAWPGIDDWLGGPHEQELAALSWADLEWLAGAGWEIGSHTCSHPRLTQLDRPALDRELRASRAACEARLGRPCQTVA
nr:polysaccharide deacetylase family protein [Actinomycetota bacterium]